MKTKPATLFLVLCAIALTGCGELPQKEKDIQYKSSFETVNYKGHKYIVFSRSAYENGITHDPDCPCHKKGGE